MRSRDGGRDLGQRRLHVAEDGDGRRIVLAEFPWIDFEMNELDVRAASDRRRKGAIA
jgi:hypothetical protein